LAGSTNPGLNTPPRELFTATNVTPDSFQFRPAQPVTGRFTASNDPNLEFLWWAGRAGGCPESPCNPPLPNTAITTISNWLRTAGPATPISWPALGVHGPLVHGNWVGKEAIRNGISDFASHYWDTKKGAKTYPWGWGTEEANTWMRDAFYNRQPYMDLERPQIMLTSLMGPAYMKGTNGGHFSPPGDALGSPGTTPQAIVSNMATAAALGNSGVRLYSYERALGVTDREKAPLGVGLQTGANPFSSSVPHWRAMAFAANLLTRVLQPFILGLALNSPAYGRNIMTAVREDQSTNKMLMIINGSDFARSVNVDFTPYKLGGDVTRYRLTARSIQSDLLPEASGESITLSDGETVVYLFFSRRGTSFARPVAIAPPAETGNVAAVRYSYIYEQMLESEAQGKLCSPNCILHLDPQLGNVYYDFLYLDSTGKVKSKSSTFVYGTGR
jgi:hypothetical protein